MLLQFKQKAQKFTPEKSTFLHKDELETKKKDKEHHSVCAIAQIPFIESKKKILTDNNKIDGPELK